MMAKILILVACLALSQAALVKRDAPAPNILDEIQKHAQEFGKTFSEQVKALAASENTEHLNKAFKDGADSVQQQLGSFASTLNNLLTEATGKTKEALEASKANLERAAEDLRKAHPEVEQQANALKERFANAVQSTAEQTQKLAKEVAANVEETNKKLAPQIQAAYNDFVKQAQEVQKKLQEAANKQ